MPPEWHPHEATWLSWPKDPLTWPDRVPQVETIFLRMIEALAEHETVNLLVDDEETEARVRARRRLTWRRRPPTSASIASAPSTPGFATTVRISSFGPRPRR